MLYWLLVVSRCDCKDISTKTRIVTWGCMMVKKNIYNIAKTFLLKQGLWHIFQFLVGRWWYHCKDISTKTRIVTQTSEPLSSTNSDCKDISTKTRIVTQKQFLLKDGLFHCKDISTKTRIVTKNLSLFWYALYLLQRHFY